MSIDGVCQDRRAGLTPSSRSATLCPLRRSKRSTPRSRPQAKSRPNRTRPRASTASIQLLGITQGRRAERKLHLGGKLPGDDQGADWRRRCQQGRQPRRPEGERNPRPLDSAGTGFPHSFRTPKSASGRRPFRSCGRRKSGSRRATRAPDGVDRTAAKRQPRERNLIGEHG